MKELSIEEKAKAYDEALKRAESLYDYDQPISTANVIINSIFPELKESEDERIRKEIIEYIKIGTYHKDWVAWLEKQGEHAKFRDSVQVGDKVTRNQDGVLVNLSQLKRVAKKDEKQGDKDIGISEATKQELEDNLNNALEKETPESWNEFLDEQKPTDKVEPKFKVGNWIVYRENIWKVGNIALDNYYELLKTNNEVATRSIKKVDENAHLWTIQDAKDGDVLATLDYILVFKEFLKNDGGISYCHYDFGAGNPQFIWLEDKNWYFGKEAIIHPATKEQRDTLFAKMKEAGYVWDADKKELKKIEQKPAWSEEDEKFFNTALWHICNSISNGELTDIRCDTTEWFKSLKDRVLPQNK